MPDPLNNIGFYYEPVLHISIPRPNESGEYDLTEECAWNLLADLSRWAARRKPEEKKRKVWWL